MFGREYLDWRAKTFAAAEVDCFLADLEPETRKWVLAVLRERFEVRVEYRDSGQLALQQALGRHRPLGAVHPFEQQRQISASSSGRGNPLEWFGL